MPQISFCLFRDIRNDSGQRKGDGRRTPGNGSKPVKASGTRGSAMSIIAFRERDFNLGDREVRGLTDSGRKGRRADVAEERDDREEMKGGRKKRRTEKEGKGTSLT